MCKLLVCVVTVLLVGCTDPSGASKVLSDNGYTDIKTGGYDWLLCADSDDYATKFTAISPVGKQVKGAVCSGFFKGATIRFE